MCNYGVLWVAYITAYNIKVNKSHEVYNVYSKYITVIQGVLQSIYGPTDTFVKNKTWLHVVPTLKWIIFLLPGILNCPFQ